MFRGADNVHSEVAQRADVTASSITVSERYVPGCQRDRQEPSDSGQTDAHRKYQPSPRISPTELRC